MIIHANRLEVIDHTSTNKGWGRQFSKWEKGDFKIEIAFQDGGNTVKIFLDDLEKIHQPNKPLMHNLEHLLA
jgi:hypothetical protein